MLKCKPDIINEGQHFDSSGTYLHNGNVGIFARNKENHNSSVSTYACKTGEEDKVASYEEEDAMVLETGVKQISKYVSIVKSIISPVFFFSRI